MNAKTITVNLESEIVIVHCQGESTWLAIYDTFQRIPIDLQFQNAKGLLIIDEGPTFEPTVTEVKKLAYLFEQIWGQQQAFRLALAVQ